MIDEHWRQGVRCRGWKTEKVDSVLGCKFEIVLKGRIWVVPHVEREVSLQHQPMRLGKSTCGLGCGKRRPGCEGKGSKVLISVSEMYVVVISCMGFES